MSRRTVFHRLAELELVEASAYYQRAAEGLGGAFLDEIERACRFVLAHPEAAPIVSRGVRRKPLRRFPYSLLYSIRENEIRVLAVAHLKRRPFYWKRRASPP